MIPTVDELNDSNSCNVKPQNDISRRDISSSSKSTFVSLTAKWGKERIDLNMLSAETTIGKVKEMLTEKTGVLPKRQKLIGLSLKSKTAGAKLMDENVLSDLKVKSGKKNLKCICLRRMTLLISSLVVVTPTGSALKQTQTGSRG